MIPFILLAAGLLLIFFEFYLPGGIVGTMGAVVVLISIILFATQNNSLLAIVLFIVFSLAMLALLIRFALWRIRHSKPGTSIYSDTSQEGFRSAKYDEAVSGKLGVASTDLRPGGHVMIEGKRWCALSQSGYIPKGADIVVLSVQGETLIVKTRKKESMS